MHNLDLLEETLHMTRDWGTATVLNVSKVNGYPELPGSPVIEVTDETVQDAALRFRGHKVCVLNFASGSMPGGGTRYGAMAQEEALCLSSGLLHGLESHLDYYMRNRADDAPDECYDHMIWSEDVPLVRNGSFELVDPMNIEVITYPAPVASSRPYMGPDAEPLHEGPLREIFHRRCRQVVRRGSSSWEPGAVVPTATSPGTWPRSSRLRSRPRAMASNVWCSRSTGLRRTRTPSLKSSELTSNASMAKVWLRESLVDPKAIMPGE